MKKVLIILISFILIITALSVIQHMLTKDETNNGQMESKTTVNIGSLKGPTSISLLKIMEDNETKSAKNIYDFTVTGTADEITAKLVKNELDIAIIPVNLASVLYNKQDMDVSVLAINNLSVLYVLENGNTISKISDLKGKTIYMTGKGTVPEYTMNYLLEKAGIANEVTLEFKSEVSEVATLLTTKQANVVILPQPYATTVQKQSTDIRVALDIGEEWNSVQGEDIEIVTAVAIVRNEFLNKNKEIVNSFLEEYKLSIEYVNSNNEEAGALSDKFDIIPLSVAKEAIPLCKIEYIDDTRMKNMVNGYLQILYNQNPKSIGGNMPGEDFYYEK